MPVVERELLIPAPIQQVWDLLNDPAQLSKCVPGCEEASLGADDEWKWKMKFNVGVISRRIEAIARVVEKEPTRKLAINLDSVTGDFKMQLHLEFAEEKPTSTRVKFAANVDARGPFQIVVNQIIKSQMAKLVGEFAANVSSKLVPNS
ncbi:MAG: CoxG family protein [Candidatus Bathyarchaeia archaeon]